MGFFTAYSDKNRVKYNYADKETSHDSLLDNFELCSDVSVKQEYLKAITSFICLQIKSKWKRLYI